MDISLDDTSVEEMKGDEEGVVADAGAFTMPAEGDHSELSNRLSADTAAP